MCNIVKRFARKHDDMLFPNFQRMRGLDAERKLLRRRCELSGRTIFVQTAFVPLCTPLNLHPALALPMRKSATV
jgi:hypothetical protein